MRCVLLFVSSLLSCLTAQQPAVPFRLAPLYGDHMVLPAEAAAPVHGFGPIGAKVVVSPSWGASIESVVRGDGRWQVEVPTPKRGATGAFSVTCGDREVAVADVVFGDVWLASGQSNMEMPLGKVGGWLGVRDWEREVASSNRPTLRVFTTRRQTADVESDRADGQWVVVSPETAAELSAVGFFFGRELVDAGVGPIGIVVSSWGGTRCEAWTRAFGLADFPEFQGALRLLAQGGDRTVAEVRREVFWRAIDEAKPDMAPVDVQMPEVWSAADLGGFDGVADYARRVTLPEALVGRDLWLELGAIDDMDVVYWNGTRIAGSQTDGLWNVARRYRVPAANNTKAVVDLLVRVVDTGGEGGFTGAASALRLVPADGQGDAVPLAGTWQRTLRRSLAALPPWPRTEANPNRPSVLWNGMIAPLLPFPFTGVIWYQGESNRGEPDLYARLFPAMVRDWRTAIGRPVPFYFVQIAPFGYGKDNGETSLLREAQAAALALPGTGMVVTLDCGEANDIHPRHKQPVGERLARLALARHYGRDVVAEGPRFSSASRRGAEVVLRFTAADGGLVLAGDGGGFELAGDDGRFVPANARVDGDSVVLRADAVAVPTALRYAFGTVPEWSLQNGAGLPAAPFRATIR